MWHASYTEPKQHDNSQDGAFKQISQKVQAGIILSVHILTALWWFRLCKHLGCNKKCCLTLPSTIINVLQSDWKMSAVVVSQKRPEAIVTGGEEQEWWDFSTESLSVLKFTCIYIFNTFSYFFTLYLFIFIQFIFIYIIIFTFSELHLVICLFSFNFTSISLSSFPSLSPSLSKSIILTLILICIQMVERKQVLDINVQS